MPLKKTERVVYQKNPLTEVICQLRFPTVLKISSEAPVKFQEAVTEVFPFFEETSPIDLPADIPADVAQMILSDLNAKGKKQYEFTSKNHEYKVTLSSDSLALTSLNYVKWEDFKSFLDIAINALQETYSIPFYTRIGLRYINFIDPKDLQIAPIWVDLIEDWLVGPYASKTIGNEVVGSGGMFKLLLQDSGIEVNIRHGISRRKSHSDTKDPEGYLIDSDFYYKETEKKDVSIKLSTLNSQSGLFFRSCIKEKLHMAMGPKPIK